jgi:hypothetical protein
VGTLTLSSNLTLNGDLLFKVNKSLAQRNDKIVVAQDLNNAGTGSLTLTNVGPGLTAGDNFQLFNKPIPNGSALTLVSDSSVVWTNKLEVDGSVEVVSASTVVPTTPTNLVYSVSGGSLQLSWPPSYQGWSLQVQTNVPGGITPSWYTLPGSESVTTMSFPLNVQNPSVFYRLIYTP